MVERFGNLLRSKHLKIGAAFSCACFVLICGVILGWNWRANLTCDADLLALRNLQLEVKKKFGEGASKQELRDWVADRLGKHMLDEPDMSIPGSESVSLYGTFPSCKMYEGYMIVGDYHDFEKVVKVRVFEYGSKYP